jgi:hypothetical protein
MTQLLSSEAVSRRKKGIKKTGKRRKKDAHKRKT